METIVIDDRESYNYVVSRGFQPLLDIRNFRLEIGLRVEIQREIFGHCVFGRGDIPAANERFYRWVWNHKPHICEETMRPLKSYSATYISHILTRGANPEIAHDPRNVNILSFECHNRWENPGEGTERSRETMRIYPGNMRIIELLKTEYQFLK